MKSLLFFFIFILKVFFSQSETSVYLEGAARTSLKSGIVQHETQSVCKYKMFSMSTFLKQDYSGLASRVKFGKASLKKLS